MSKRRICIHIWRRRGRWFSHTRGHDIYCCRPCRKRWARERMAFLKEASRGLV